MVQDYINFGIETISFPLFLKDGKGGRGLKPENLEPEF